MAGKPLQDDRIAAIRTDYRMAVLDEEMAGPDPLQLFARWFEEAQAAAIDEVNAMTLATADAVGMPHARIVLLKGLDEQGFVFYTNYESAKGQQLAARPDAALVFFWKELERQVRIEGRIEKVSAAASDAYFNSRPEGSKIGAIASPQSRRIESRAFLEAALQRLQQQYSHEPVTRPEHWGGYRLVPKLVEFWQGRSSRLHDRLVFERAAAGLHWERYRLAP